MKGILKFIGVTSRRSAWFLFVGSMVIGLYSGFNYWYYQPITELKNAEFQNVMAVQVSATLFITFLLSTVGGWLLFSNKGKLLISEITNEVIPKNNLKRLLKVLFACYGIALAIFIVIIVVGLFLAGPDFSEKMFTLPYAMPYFLIMMVLTYPVVSKKLT